MAERPSGPPTRPSLLLRLRDRQDDSSWREFVDVYGPIVHGYCRRRGLQDADAAEVMQEVLLRVYRAIATFDYRPEQGRFRDWLWTITRNQLHTFWKKAGALPTHGQADASGVLRDVAAAEQDGDWTEAFYRRLLQVALARIRTHFEEHTWRAFELVWLQNRPAAEAARALGQELDWVYMAKSRVLKRLQEEVQDLAEDTLPYTRNG